MASWKSSQTSSQLRWVRYDTTMNTRHIDWIRSKRLQERRLGRGQREVVKPEKRPTE